MRSSRSARIASSCSLLLTALLVGCGSGEKSPPAAEVVHKLTFSTEFPFWRGEVVKLAEGGEIELKKEYGNRLFKPRPGEYLALAVPGSIWKAQEEFDVDLMKVQLVKARKKQFTIKAEDAAAKRLKPGSLVVLLQPGQVTKADLAKVPEVVTLKFEGMTPRDFLGIRDEIVMSVNLRQIGVALHEYHDAHRSFPPAVIYGPDGRPWHSWRVLLLPYLDEGPLYRRYRFDEPWDSPHNRELIKHIPSVYRQPATDDRFSNLMIATTPWRGLTKDERHARSAFPSDRRRIDSYRRWEDLVSDLQRNRLRAGPRIPRFIDGLSNTIVAGVGKTGEDIPWTKPVDAVFTEDVLSLGSDGGFDAPYTHAGEAFGLFLLADGAVQKLPKSLPLDQLRKLVCCNDQQDVGELPKAGRPKRKTNRVEIKFLADGAAIVREYLSGADEHEVAEAVEAVAESDRRRKVKAATNHAHENHANGAKVDEPDAPVKP